MGVRANLIRVTVTTVGTGSLTIGGAVSNFRPLSSIPDGSVINYGIQDTGGNETGWGVVGGSGTTLTRNLIDSSTGSLISLSGAAQLIETSLSRDFHGADLAVHAGLGGL